MLQSVKDYLSLFGEVDERILEAMKKIDRKDFMEKNKELAYINTAISIGYGQTISQPSTIARMLSLLKLKKHDFVLEIGTGSSWNASLISYLIKPGKIISLEIVKELVKNSKDKTKKAGIKNIEIREGDFRKLKEKFDKIIFTAGISHSQEELIKNFAAGHLNEKGILVCPYQSGPLIIIKKINNKIEKTWTNEEYMFVPLIL